jgi:ankyrin repeat protein
LLSDIAKRIIETRPGLATEEAIIETRPGLVTEEAIIETRTGGDTKIDENVKVKRITPMQLAVQWNRVEVLKVLLEHDRSLGYEISAYDEPLLVSAAFGGHVGIAKEILNHCPDAPYRKKDGWTYLHQAVWCDQLEFVEFILGSQQLRNKLVNMRNNKGKTALHYAVQKCNPIMVSALLSHKEIDFTMFDKDHKTAIWKLFDAGNHAKTLNWVSTYTCSLEISLH